MSRISNDKLRLDILQETAENMGVENRMFFGHNEIVSIMFRSRIRHDLLRRWIHYADFPAPFLPRGKMKLRVTTWGLVEAWLLTLYQHQYDSPLNALQNDKLSRKQRNLAIQLVKSLHSGQDVDNAIKKAKLEEATEQYIEKRIRTRVKLFEQELRSEVALTINADTAPRKRIDKRIARARATQGIKS